MRSPTDAKFLTLKINMDRSGHADEQQLLGDSGEMQQRNEYSVGSCWFVYCRDETSWRRPGTRNCLRIADAVRRRPKQTRSNDS